MLFIDDRLSDPTIGSGFGRMSDAVVELSKAGYAVSVWSSRGVHHAIQELGLRGIETIVGGLEAHLREPSILYDMVVISEPDNFERYEALVRDSQPHSLLIYDAETVHHHRIECHAKQMAGPQATGLADRARRMRALETSVRARADFVTCVSPAEEEFFRSTKGTAPIALVPPSHRDVRSVPFAECVVSRHREAPQWTAAGDATRACVTVQDLRTDGAWVEALVRAQLTRSDTG